MQNLNNKNKLLELLTQEAIVITPNNRLSAALLYDFFIQSDKKTVDKPCCLPYSTLIIKAYHSLGSNPSQWTHPTLLNNAQCQHLWQKIIKSHPYVTYSKGLLNAVMQAWEHCLQWQIEPENTAFQYTPQTRQFQQWWQVFDKQLLDLNAISEYQIIPYLLNTQRSFFSQPLIWACFDEFNPQQLSLQKHLSNQGLTQYYYDLKEQGCPTTVLAAQDTNDEYQQLMAWLHSKIQQGNTRIGVVVPNLEQESRALQRILTQHFDPAVFNISLGQGLNEFPLVAHALNWLNLDHQSLNHHQTALLLQSPYIGGSKAEFTARSQYLQDSSLLQDQSFSLKSFTNDIQNQTPKLAEYLSKIIPYPKKASPEEWITLFQNRLNAIGFPGDYGLNSINYQCLNRFTAVFDEFRQLSLISSFLNKDEALDSLTQLTENTIFQAQKTNPLIQVSGLLEASGCEFDSLWVMGLTDQCLPQKIRLSAFISPQLQRELRMPHSDPDRELQFAQQTLQRLRRGSANTVLSYSQLQGDNPNLPSALITAYPMFTRISVTDKITNKSALISREESYHIPIKTMEHVAGGTALLANQAKCPFKAFAEHRLTAKPSLATINGLDNREKGQIIHKIMELLWGILGSQEALFKIHPDDLNQHIETAIHTALTPFKQTHADTFPDLIEEVENTRLKRLVLSALDWEKQRPPFTVVALEQSYSLNLAGLDFKVRVDRLDQIADKKWVIDYKSSLPTSKPWNEDRPKEPQLLLYALLDQHINALLLMQLKNGHIICSGLSEEKQDISGISSLKKDDTWEEYRAKWEQQLTGLAEEFQQGQCQPQPASASICQQCDFQNLCRFEAVE